jgi:hypothetical protein
MAEGLASVAKLSVPLGWVAALLLFEAGVVLWMGNLQNRVDNLTRNGSDNVQSLVSRMARLEAEIDLLTPNRFQRSP